jgi:hypothetical protein
LRQIGVNRNCSAYIAESGSKFGISQTSMHSSKNVVEYVIVKIVMHVMQPRLCVMMSFCRIFHFKNIPNLLIIVKTDDPERVRERERIKKFICKPVYFIEKYSGR